MGRKTQASFTGSLALRAVKNELAAAPLWDADVKGGVFGEAGVGGYEEFGRGRALMTVRSRSPLREHSGP